MCSFFEEVHPLTFFVLKVVGKILGIDKYFYHWSSLFFLNQEIPVFMKSLASFITACLDNLYILVQYQKPPSEI